MGERNGQTGKGQERRDRSKVTQVTFIFALTTAPISRWRWGEDVIVVKQQCDDRVRDVGRLSAHIAGFPPLAAVVKHLLSRLSSSYA